MWLNTELLWNPCWSFCGNSRFFEVVQYLCIVQTRAQYYYLQCSILVLNYASRQRQYIFLILHADVHCVAFTPFVRTGWDNKRISACCCTTDSRTLQYKHPKHTHTSCQTCVFGEGGQQEMCDIKLPDWLTCLSGSSLWQ